jgi:tetratricopeptide (TPR) repeat protein
MAAFHDPENAEHHRDLGRVLALNGRLRPAETAIRKACELDGESAGFLQSLGAVLEYQGRFDEAETTFRRALELDPDRWSIHVSLGDLHLTQGRPDEAVERLLDAARLVDDDPLAHSLLARALVAARRFDGARTAVRKAVELGPETEHDVVWTETLAWTLERVRTAETSPRTPEDRLVLAAHSIASSRDATRAAREFEAAFAAEPRLAGQMHWRLLAARAAATVGTGMARDGSALDAEERAQWRTRALGWLREELVRRRREPRLVRLWLLAPQYAGVREKILLESLPDAERKAWQAFWAEVRDVLKKAEEAAK